MPRQYEAMRDEFKRECLASGKGEKWCDAFAKRKAARIYNSKHPNNPVGRHSK